MTLTRSDRAWRRLAELAGGGPIRRRMVIVVAHPDDETVAMGAQLRRLCNALLLHLTDGAPRDNEDARRNGFATPRDYAAARRRELAAALQEGDARGLRLAEFALPDKQAFLDLEGLARRLIELLRTERPAAVLTHAYEGGHPDHDAAAFAVQAACRCLPDREQPVIIEMPFYHAAEGRMVTGEFLHHNTAELAIPLAGPELWRKRAMAECFATQREVLASFQLTPERFRPAPAYDFRAPPHSGALLYEMFGWRISGAEWRRRASEALARLALA